MKKVILISILLGCYFASYSQPFSEVVYKLEKGSFTDVNIPKELIIKPNGLIVISGDGTYDNLHFNHGTILFKEDNSGINDANFKLQFKAHGKLKGTVNVAGSTEALIYMAYYSCSNHDPKHSCKLGDDPKTCGVIDCVF
jgi:hypothetical protein